MLVRIYDDKVMTEGKKKALENYIRTQCLEIPNAICLHDVRIKRRTKLLLDQVACGERLQEYLKVHF